MIEFKNEIRTIREGKFSDNLPVAYDMNYPINTKDNLPVNALDNALKPVNNFYAPTVVNIKTYHISFDFSSYSSGDGKPSGGVLSGLLCWVLVVVGIYYMFQIGFGTSVDIMGIFENPLGGLMQWL